MSLQTYSMKVINSLDYSNNTEMTLHQPACVEMAARRQYRNLKLK
jgi:hypothetical protein